MGGTVRKIVNSTLLAPFANTAGALAVAALLAGCSSDVSRFNAPVFGLTQAQPTPSQPIGDGVQPAHAEGYTPGNAPPPDYNNNNFGDNAQPNPNYQFRGSAPHTPYAANTSAYPGAPSGFGTMPGQPESYHPERLASNGPTPYVINPATVPSAANAAPLYVPPTAQPAGPAGSMSLIPHRPKPGALVEVLPGETLYMFARRNGVSISAVMSANNMHSPNVQAGMKLLIPGKGGRSILPPTASLLPAAPAATSTTALAATSSAPVLAPGGTYTVQAGDSVYSIARKHNLKPQDIMSLNGVTDVTKVKFGQVLKMPATAGGSSSPIAARTPKSGGTQLAALQPLPGNAAPVMSDAPSDGIPDGATANAEDGAPAESNDMAPAATAPAKPSRLAPVPVKSKSSGPVDPASAPIIGKTNSSALASASADVGSDPAADAPSDGRFRWPVRGRIIGKFGQSAAAGAQNEGIDLAVPMGTEVHAAENGVVAYVGDELKGYGKLVLVRHADNWVTAYAHNDELLVKRGDQIRRGQVIAKAGKSGGIDQPLLHFELRKGSQPVDPMPHMASN